MARVVRFHETGGPEVLKIEEVDVPPTTRIPQTLAALAAFR